MAVGNAVTAIGGDIGTIGINPAGSAIANYGQFVISGAVFSTNVKSDFSIFGDKEIDGTNVSKRSKFSLPNVGASFVYHLGREYGLKTLSFGILYTQNKRYDNFSAVSALNGSTSKMAEFAAAASGIKSDLLANYNSFYNTDISWDLLTAYQGGAISQIDDSNQYAAVTQALKTGSDKPFIPGDLRQHAIANISGHKSDLLLNFGGNISDQFYFGINLGIPFTRYSYTETFTEQAVDPDQFAVAFSTDGKKENTNFKQANYTYRYISDVDGIYAKLGFIYTNSFLRFGAAIQTPTVYTVSEKWNNSVRTTFTDSKWNANQDSLQGDYTYNLISPFSFNLGLAVTLGEAGFISFDYERTDYSTMRFRDVNYNYSVVDTFQDLNESNRLFAGASNHFRLGAEFRLSPWFSVRGGFNTCNYPERYYQNDGDTPLYVSDYKGAAIVAKERRVADRTNIYSFGLGYSSPGSFFCDLAASFTQYPKSSFKPYPEYTSYDSVGKEQHIPAPLIFESRKLLNIMMTLGWRF